MKIENLVEKDTVLDDDYLIVDGTDGTKKAKKSVFLKETNDAIKEKANVKDLSIENVTTSFTLAEKFKEQDINSVVILTFDQYISDSPFQEGNGMVISYKNTTNWGTQFALVNGGGYLRAFEGSETPTSWTRFN